MGAVAGPGARRPRRDLALLVRSMHARLRACMQTPVGPVLVHWNAWAYDGSRHPLLLLLLQSYQLQHQQEQEQQQH